MTRIFNLVFQIVATLGQIFSVVSGMIPGKYQVLVATIIGALQAVVGVVAHNYNPDGTPATQKYIAP